jgi:hypothetical protein
MLKYAPPNVTLSTDCLEFVLKAGAASSAVTFFYLFACRKFRNLSLILQTFKVTNITQHKIAVNSSSTHVPWFTYVAQPSTQLILPGEAMTLEITLTTEQCK